MKNRFTAMVLLLVASISLGGCLTLDPNQKSVLQGGPSLTAVVANPVTGTEIYQLKVAFAGSQEVVKKYQRDCFGSQLPPYPVSFASIQADPALSVLCAHRVSRYNVMKKSEDKAYRAIAIADQFTRDNPTGNPASYIAAAWKAMNDYKAKAGS